MRPACALRWAFLSFAVILIVHSAYIFLWATDIPMWDQWDAEAEWYKILVSGNWDLPSIIAAHNEHRIAVSRLFFSGIFRLFGGWTPIGLMYAQVPLIAAAVAGVVYLLARYCERWRTTGIIFTLLAFCLPYSWGNILSGFQNQFYFMLLFAFGSLMLGAVAKSFLGQLGGLILAALSPFTMAGGIGTLAAFAVVLICLVVAGKIRLSRFITLLSILLGIIFWHAIHLVHVSAHDALRAQSVGELLISILKILGWPQVPIGFVLWGVLVLSIIHSIKYAPDFRGWMRNLHAMQIFLFGISGWLLFQIFATAATRTHADLMASRYQQTFSLIVPLFFLSLGVFQVRISRNKMLAVLVLCVVGLMVRSVKEWPYMLQNVREGRFAREQIVRAACAGDFDLLKAQDTNQRLGYFHAEGIWQQVSFPSLKSRHLWLPKECRL